MTTPYAGDVNRHVYDMLAEEYAARAEHSRKWLEASMGTHFMPHLEGKENCCLDIGCGVGVGAEMLQLAGHWTYGIDVSTEMIRCARRDRRAGTFLVADYTKTHLAPERYTGILCFAFLHLFPKEIVPLLVSKMWIELVPGGVIYTGSSIEQESKEGWEYKADYADGQEHPRWRARYAEGEMLNVLTNSAQWHVIEADNRFVDDFGKVWSDILLRKPAS